MKLYIYLVLATLVLTSCQKANNEALVGADKDSHGCIGSAGYLWCAKENQCARPWELAKDKQFENSTEAFGKYCGN